MQSSQLSSLLSLLVPQPLIPARLWTELTLWECPLCVRCSAGYSPLVHSGSLVCPSLKPSVPQEPSVSILSDGTTWDPWCWWLLPGWKHWPQTGQPRSSGLLWHTSGGMTSQPPEAEAQGVGRNPGHHLEQSLYFTNGETKTQRSGLNVLSLLSGAVRM